MLNFSKAKALAVWLVCAFGVLFTLPNFIPQGTLPDWVPQRHVNLGLDLQGGSYLLLEVDLEAGVRERLEGTLDSVRAAFRAAGIRYTDLTVRNRGVEVRLNAPSQSDTARQALKDLLAPGANGPEFVLSSDNGLLRLPLTEAAITAKAARAVEQSIEIVRRRIDETGVNEPVIARQGSNRILIQLPGVADPSRIKRLLGQTAKMTFHLLEDDGRAAGSPPPPGAEWLPSSDPASRGQRYLVRKKVEVDGATLRDARPGPDQQSASWVVSFEFDAVGARRFADVTTRNVGRPFAIVLDGKVISAPVIREPIMGGSGIISGKFTVQAANDLALLLRAGALPAPMNVLEERTVGPDLGADSIRAGAIASGVGLVLVMLFMVAGYGLFGWFANVALIVNLVLLMALLSVLGATLTLPGIAGIVLTMGMAVDANVLIYERMREEYRNGRTLINAMQAGFERALVTILDSNLTTLLAAGLLFWFGAGPIRGFAVTLTLGLFTSMFTAVMVTRLLLVLWIKRARPKHLPIEGIPA